MPTLPDDVFEFDPETDPPEAVGAEPEQVGPQDTEATEAAE